MKRRQMMSLCFFVDRAYGLPLFLQFGNGICGLLPVGTVLQSLGALTEGSLALKIGCAHIPHLSEIIAFCGKEVIAGLTETGKRALFTFFEAKPSFFHSSCAARISLVACSQDE